MAESPNRPVDATQDDVPRGAKPGAPAGNRIRGANSDPASAGPFRVLPMQFGRYQIDKLLGTGAMGAVYLAHDSQLERPVALKVARTSAAGSDQLIQRMETEAQAAARIDHPLICKVYDFGEIDGIRFIALQYIEGEDLKSYLKRVGRRREPAEAVKLILQISRALKVAHAKGVIHRDLKPGNVMLNRKGEPVIMDFGLARRLTGATDAGLTQGMIVGTGAYMSPEQAIGRADGIDQRSDLYALGVMLFEMLTGEWPFKGSALEVMGLKCVKDAPSPLSINAKLPARLAEVCQKLIAQKKEDRYTNCEELIAALEAIDLKGTVALAEGVDAPGVSSPIANQSSPSMMQETLPFADQSISSTSVGMRHATHKPVPLRRGSGLLGFGRKRLLGAACSAGLILLAVIIVTTANNDHTKTEDPAMAVTEGPVATKIEMPIKGSEAPAKVGWHGWPADAPPPAIAPFDAEHARKCQEAWAAYLKVPVEYTNSIGMKFRLIPPGEFLMGSTPAEIDKALALTGDDVRWKTLIRSEGPQHRVILTQPIYLGVHEVTQAEYEQVMGKNPSNFSPTGGRKDAVAGLDTTRHPVEMVSWNDAAEFCAKLSQSEKLEPFYSRAGEAITFLKGTGYRLPTDAEWEFACRAGTTSRFWIGDEDEDLVPVAWYGVNSGGRTHTVGKLQANPFRLLDMPGNVWEWVQDEWWGGTYYSEFTERPAINPSGPVSSGSQRLIRGGYWNDPAFICRGSSHHADRPGSRFDAIGLRVSLTINAVKAATGSYGWPADAPSPAVAPFDGAQAKKHQEAWATYLKIPVEYTNSIGMKFRLIPPGEFLMGTPPEEIEQALIAVGGNEEWKTWIRGEVQHKVILTQPIYLGVTEVTQAEFERVMGRNPSHFSALGEGKGAVAGMDTTRHPVEMVSWPSAAEFCAKLSIQEKLKPFYDRAGDSIIPLNGTGYRLPTEAEWEFACRAGTTTKYWSSDDDEDLVRIAWFGMNAARRTHSVGKLQANLFGLFDIHGNVWEWVQDGWQPTISGELVQNPTINPDGPSFSGSQRVIRGGSWPDAAFMSGSSHRHPHDPLFHKMNLGFRVALVVKPRLAADAGSPPGELPANEPKNATTDDNELPVGEWIDLLAMVKLPDHVMLGSWKRMGESVTCEALPDARFMVPVGVAGNYELSCKFTRRTNNEAIVLVLPVGETSCEVNVDAWGGAVFGLHLIDKRSAIELVGTPAAIRTKEPLVNGVSHELRVSVAQKETMAAIEVAIDGNRSISWKGNVSQLSGWPTSYLPAPHAIGVRTFASVVDIQQLKLRLSPGGRAFQLRDDWKNPLFEVADKPAGDVVTSIMDSTGKKYLISDKPLSLSDSQLLATHLKGRLLTISSSEEENFIRSHGHRRLLWMAGWRPPSAVLEWRDERNRPLRHAGRWASGQPDRHKNEEWNLFFATEASRLLEGWHDIGVNTGANDIYACIEWGEEYPDGAIPFAETGDWVDLLEWAEGVDWAPRGTDWNENLDAPPTRKEITFKSVDFGRFPLPAIIDGDYELELEFTRENGTEGVGAVFPVGIHNLCLEFGSVNGSLAGVGRIDGKTVHENSTGRRPSPVKNNQQHQINLRVHTNGVRAAFNIDWDKTKDYITWEGPTASLANNDAGGAFRVSTIRRPWLISHFGHVTFQKARVRMLSGRIHRDVITDADREQDLKNGFVRLVGEKMIGNPVALGPVIVNQVGLGEGEIQWPLVARHFKVCDDYYGAHAPSRLQCPIPTGARSFSVIAYNDGLRTVKNLVFVDGKQVHDSGVTAIAIIKVDIPADASLLELVADPTGNNEADFAYWCFPRFHSVAAGNVTDKMLDGKPSSLLFRITSSEVGWGSLTHDEPIAGSRTHPVHFRDALPCDEFIFAHAPSSVKYQVPDGMTRFTAIGYNVKSHHVMYQVWADMNRIYQSPQAGIVPIDIKLPPGTKTIELKVDDLGDSNSDWSMWCYPRLHRD